MAELAIFFGCSIFISILVILAGIHSEFKATNNILRKHLEFWDVNLYRIPSPINQLVNMMREDREESKKHQKEIEKRFANAGKISHYDT